MKTQQYGELMQQQYFTPSSTFYEAVCKIDGATNVLSSFDTEREARDWIEINPTHEGATVRLRRISLQLLDDPTEEESLS